MSARLLGAIKDWLVVTEDDIKAMPDADDDCPHCESTLKEDQGFVTAVHYCPSCRFEGATR